MEFNIDFQDSGHRISNRTILAIFDLQVTSILSMKFRVNWPFGSGEKVQNKFSTSLLGQPSWIFDQNGFS